MPLGIVKNEDYERSLGNKPPESKTPEDIPQEDRTPTESERTPNTENNSCVANQLAEIFNPPTRGRGNGNTAVPDGVRQIIGEAAIKEGSAAASAIGDFLGLSQSSVSAYQKGATSTASYDKPKPELVDHLLRVRQRISKRASGKLLKTLDTITDDKLQILDAVQASNVAKNMSAIVKHMEPEAPKIGNINNGPVITFYAPRMVKEEVFEVIQVNE